MTDDFGYLNARIRARRSQLLHEGFFREALKLSFPELVKVLGESIYGQDLTGDTLADIDLAVSIHLNRTVADLPHLVSGQTHEAIRLLLARSDLTNVKIILRGKQAGWSKEDIIARLVAGTLPRSLYSVLVEADDAASLAQLLALPKHPLARALREAAAATGKPLAMEIILDRSFHSHLLRRSREVDQPYLASYMAVEVDALNLSTGFKLFTIGLKDQLEQFFLPGGVSVGFPLFQRLAAGDSAALEQLGDTTFSRIAEVRSLSELERGLRCILLTQARTCAKDVLGAGLAIDYIHSKQWEAGRIRLLARRAYYGLPSASFEQELFANESCNSNRSRIRCRLSSGRPGGGGSN